MCYDDVIIAITIVIVCGIWSFTVIVLALNKRREKDQ